MRLICTMLDDAETNIDDGFEVGEVDFVDLDLLINPGTCTGSVEIEEDLWRLINQRVLRVEPHVHV